MTAWFTCHWENKEKLENPEISLKNNRKKEEA